jgi:hypothetical protein
MRYLFGFLCVCALGLVPVVGCFDVHILDNPCEGLDCDDGNECTRDYCTHFFGINAGCNHDPVSDGVECSRNGVGGVCIGGVCDVCERASCEPDDNTCTTDCNPATGTCDYTPLNDGTKCDDGDDNECAWDVCFDGACTGDGRWMENGTPCTFDGAAGVCVEAVCGENLCEGVSCDDNNVCTRGTCDYVDGMCDFTSVVCDDRNICTEDTCDRVNGCEATPVDDGTPCGNGAGVCQAGNCVGTFACTEQGIRDAVAVGGGPHTFDCGGPQTVVTGATIRIDNSVILDGEGNLTVDANATHRVFWVRTDVSAELRGVTVTGGATLIYGGGIYNRGTVTLTNSTVSGNASGQGGGGIANDGTLTMTNSTVRDNTAEDGSSDGIANAGTLTMTNSTVSGNADSGIPGDGQQALPAGAILNEGTMTVTNSTVSGNITLSASGSATLMNTLIDGECTGDDPTSNGYNIESPGDTCGFDPDGTDQVSVNADDLNLGELADNGGLTETHALGLLPTRSVAIDQIPAADCVDADGELLTEDQRGLPRPVAILGPEPKCDVGAFEVQP